MNKISKDLKKDAERLLPDENLKKELRENLFPEREPQRAKPRRSLTFAMSAVACVLVIAIAIAVILSFPTGGKEPSAPITGNADTLVLIDINPSFEVVADKNGNVKTVTGLNSDARIVLLGKTYVGKSVYEVCTDIISTSINLGYVNNKHGQVNISTYNEDATIGQEYLSALTSNVNELVSASGGTLVATEGEEAKQKLIDEIIAAYGQTTGLDEKTVQELHRILKNYDVTKEKELDRLEDLWEEELEKAGFDDDTMEDIIDEWKEQYLKPLGEELEEELEYYIDIYELKLIAGGMTEKQAKAAAEEKEYELTELGRQDRTALRSFIDGWWKEAEEEFYSIISDKLSKDGKTPEEISDFSDLVSNILTDKNQEDRKEIMAELIEGYYDFALDQDEDDEYWEEFLEELFEEDD